MPPGVAALTPDQLRALVDVSRRARKIRRAAAVARFGGWTGAVFAAITLLSALLSFAPSTVFIGLGLGLVALGEFHGAALLRRLDVRGPRRLALNQVLLGAVLCGYAAWCLISGPGTVEQSSGSAEVDAMVAGVMRSAHIAVYGSLLVIGVAVPGLTAWYYLSRGKSLAELRASSEPSLLEALKAA